MTIDGDVLSIKTTSFEEIEKLSPVDRLIDIEEIPEITIPNDINSEEPS